MWKIFLIVFNEQIVLNLYTQLHVRCTACVEDASIFGANIINYYKAYVYKNHNSNKICFFS